VVRIASRGPTRAEILCHVATSTRWIRHAAVREALVFNPFTPAGIALKYLPTLAAPAIRHVAGATELAPNLRAAARRLMTLDG
jgi:hypothetical protein